MKQHLKTNKDERLYRLEIIDWILVGLIALNVVLIIVFLNVDKVLIFLLDTLGINELFLRS